MRKSYLVYCYTNSKNGKRYVGCTQTSMQKRAGKDGVNYKGSPYFYAAIQKYGWSSFKGRVIKSGLTRSQAARLEKEYIQRYNTMNSDFGYNLQKGGFVTKEYSKVYKKARAKRISETLKEERKSVEYRRIMSERMKRVWKDPVKRASMLKSRKGKLTGRKAIKVICIDTGEVFPSIKEACRRLIFQHSTVTLAFREGRQSVTLLSHKLERRVTIAKFCGPVEKSTVNKESELLRFPKALSATTKFERITVIATKVEKMTEMTYGDRKPKSRNNGRSAAESCI